MCQREGNGNPIQCHPLFLPVESHGQGSLVGYSPWSRKESNMTKQLTHTHYVPESFQRHLIYSRHKIDKTPALHEFTFYNRWEEGRIYIKKKIIIELFSIFKSYEKGHDKRIWGEWQEVVTLVKVVRVGIR